MTRPSAPEMVSAKELAKRKRTLLLVMLGIVFLPIGFLNSLAGVIFFKEYWHLAVAAICAYGFFCGLSVRRMLKRKWSL